MRSLERLALVGALAAAVTISGTLNARVKDLAQQRDIYQSRAANWEQDALNWQTEAQEAEAQVADLKNDLEAAQTGPAGFSAVYLGEFNCTAYCSEQYEHICGTGDGITASGAPVQAAPQRSPQVLGIRGGAAQEITHLTMAAWQQPKPFCWYQQDGRGSQPQKGRF